MECRLPLPPQHDAIVEKAAGRVNTRAREYSHFLWHGCCSLQSLVRTKALMRIVLRILMRLILIRKTPGDTLSAVGVLKTWHGSCSPLLHAGSLKTLDIHYSRLIDIHCGGGFALHKEKASGTVGGL